MSEFEALPQSVDVAEEDNDAAEKASASTKRKAKKKEKKLGRKQAQYKRVVEELGVAFTDSSTPYLFVANGGLDNGVDRESLVALFSRYGVLQRALMPRHKAYALLEFSSGAQAACARAALTGAVVAGAAAAATMTMRAPLYILHLSCMPRHCPCEDGDDAAAFSAPLPRGLSVLRDFVDEDEERRLVEFFGGDDDSGGAADTAGESSAESPGAPVDGERAAEHREVTSAGSADARASRRSAVAAPAAETVHGSLKHRRVRHYGYEFRYGTNDVDPTRPLRHGDEESVSVSGLPSLLDAVLLRLVGGGKSLGTGEPIVAPLPDQLTVNDYQPGQGIPPHVDTSWAFEDAIFSLSLLSPVVMDFRHADGRYVPVWLPRRSLLVMSGESRYSWSHGITPRKVDCVPASLVSTLASNGDGTASLSPAATASVTGLTLVPRSRRLSLTLRKIIKEPRRPPLAAATAVAGKENAAAIAAAAADGPPSQSQFVAPTTEEEAVEMETKHVYEVYDSIAAHFSSTRHTPWPRVVEFLNRLDPGAFVLDVGCGNGKYMNVNTDTVSIGCDRSIGLTTIAKERGLNVAVADILQLPYRSDFFDACLCIAVVHHLVTRDRRLRALRELLRVVRRGTGRVLVYVWAQEQEKCAAKGRKKNHGNADDGVAAAGTQAQAREAQRDSFRQQDVLVPWKFAEPGKKKDKVAAAKAKSRTASVSSTASATAAAAAATDGSGDDRGGGGGATPAAVDACRADTAAGGVSGAATAVAGGGDPTAATCAGSSDAAASSATSDVAVARPGEVYQRFYHVFVRSELEELCRELSDVAELRECYHDKGNWCAVLQKR